MTQETNQERSTALARSACSAFWEHSQFKGGRKWVCWEMGAWVTYRKGQPLHIGFDGKYLGTWEMTHGDALKKLEQMHRERLGSN